MDILLANVAADMGKKPYDLAFPFNRLLNFGLLSIATYARDWGLDTIVWDPQADLGRPAREWLLDVVGMHRPRCVGLSCVSGFSQLPTYELATAIKEAYPKTWIIVGGKDHIGQFPEEALAECPAIDAVVTGEAEETVVRLAKGFRQGLSIAEIDGLSNVTYRRAGAVVRTPDHDVALNLKDLPALDFKLYPDYRKFAPSVEVGRGCPYHCEFCVSARTGVRKKPIEAIVSEIEDLTRLYEDPDLKLYLQTPMFLMSEGEVAELARLRTERRMGFTWRTSSRVDYLTAPRLPLLYEAGMRVVDVGFESGSPDILVRMAKTTSPDDYLRKASEMIHTCGKLGITLKLNVLFYIGESHRSFEDTLRFLESHLRYVSAVSAYPLLLYPGSSLEGAIAQELAEHGGAILDDPAWSSRHLWPVNPSGTFSYNELERIGILYGKAFQTAEAFYQQKRYGYFAPDVSYGEFLEAVERYGWERLPISKSRTEAKSRRRALWRWLAMHKEAVVGRPRPPVGNVERDPDAVAAAWEAAR